MTITLDRRTVGAIARAFQDDESPARLGHAECIARIARALGFSDGNALMARLKAAEDRGANAGTTTAAAIREAGFGYRLCLDFISDQDGLDDLDLAGVDYQITEGAAIGGALRIERRPLSRTERDALAIEYGSEPGFFLEEIEEPEDFDNDQARQEGWELVESGTFDRPVIRRADPEPGQKPAWASDEAALLHVIRRADRGSAYHRAALDAVSADPREAALIAALRRRR